MEQHYGQEYSHFSSNLCSRMKFNGLKIYDSVGQEV